MKIEFIRFTTINGEPNIERQTYKFKRGYSLSVVQPKDIDDIPSFKITRVGFFKFKLEVRSDNYRKLQIEPPLRNPFNAEDDITKPLELTPIGTNEHLIPNWEDPDGTIRHKFKGDTVTRKQLKETRKRLFRIKYGPELPKKKKKVGLFGRIIAWIANRL